MDYNWVDGPGGFKSHSPYMNTNTVVTNNTNFDSGRKVKSLKVTTKEYYDEDGKLVSKEKVEEFEYEPSGIQYPKQPYIDPYQLLRDKMWPQNPVVWSSDKGLYDRITYAAKDTALDLD